LTIDLFDALRSFAFGLPGAYEDHPWGESVAKVDGKVFAFFGVADEAGRYRGVTVKLPDSAEPALTLPYAERTGYNLGKSGWVTLRPAADAPLDLFLDWVEESYRAVAPRRRVKELDASASRRTQRRGFSA
jgi:predicted DNA-binding protein (MmcQ/YjbR family)